LKKTAKALRIEIPLDDSSLLGVQLRERLREAIVFGGCAAPGPLAGIAQSGGSWESHAIPSYSPPKSWPPRSCYPEASVRARVLDFVSKAAALQLSSIGIR